MSGCAYTATVDPPWALDAWRIAARAALRAEIAPEDIAWGGDAHALRRVVKIQANYHAPGQKHRQVQQFPRRIHGGQKSYPLTVL